MLIFYVSLYLSCSLHIFSVSMSVKHIIPVLFTFTGSGLSVQFRNLDTPPSVTDLLMRYIELSSSSIEYPLLILYVLEIALQPPQHHFHISVSAVNAIVFIIHELSCNFASFDT